MQPKKAADYLQESIITLTQTQASLQNALTSAQKPQTKQEIQDPLNAVTQALQQCSTIATSMATQ